MMRATESGGNDVRDADVRELLDQRDVLDAVVSLFVATDRRDWMGVESCFSERVRFDMTSLAGGAPAEVTPSQIAGGWREGLSAIDHVHHQVGNFQVRVRGDEADVSCHGTAYHHREIAGPENTRTFVGTYEIHLRRGDAGWRIDRFRYDSRFVTGNLGLESA
jgi:hypothetical protein